MSYGTERLGRVGEQLATRHLQRAGLQVLARNWRARGAEVRGELDIVAYDPARPGTLVVCEVKTRRGACSPDIALGAVDPRKQRQLRRLAAVFLASWDRPVAHVRFDVVAVTWPAGGGRVTITHLQGVT